MNKKNIKRKTISPASLKRQIELSKEARREIEKSRQVLRNILQEKDKRFVVIVGPCSIHDESSALDYANRLKKISQKIDDKLFIVMRTYFEKPRTALGWRGFLQDPFLDGSESIEEGIMRSRKIMKSIAETGIPLAVEIVNPLFVPYFDDLISWGAIGARTVESSYHRQVASDVPFPVGFKNNIAGETDSAIKAVLVAKNKSSFLNINEQGEAAVFKGKGNPDTHIILRGGKKGPNYYESFIKEAEKKLMKLKLPRKIMIDCSHDNSNNNFKNQKKVVEDIIRQKKMGNQSIFGLMLESNIKKGKQEIKSCRNLEYGISVTDACIGWKETEDILNLLYRITF